MNQSTRILLALSALVGIAPACGMASENLASRSYDDSTANGGGVEGTGAGGGRTIDSHFGSTGGGEEISPSALCGNGCIPETGIADNCEGNSGGGGSGGQAGPLSCQLVATDDGVVGQCTDTFGPGEQGGVCFSAADCTPGHGCVTPGVCRAYCCGDEEACPEQTFCKTSVIADSDDKSGNSFASIPTCMPVSPCTLLDDNSCEAEKECTIVREDGTTSCDTPGTGAAGDACPCAKDHVCSKGINQCFKICRTDDAQTCPPDYTCQGGSKNYPDGFGICVSN